MRFRRLVVLVAAAATASLAVTTTAQASEVTKWNQVATSTLALFPMPAGGAAPALQVNMGMVQGAVYDAINSIEPRHRPYLLDTLSNSMASKDAAAARAAYVVLSNIVATVPAGIAFPNKSALQTTLDNAYTQSLADIPDAFEALGIAAGDAAAQAMITARQGDGRFGSSAWVPNSAVGHWQPLLNTDGTQMLDPTPWVGNVDPFVMTSSSQFRTDGPNDLRSKAYADDYNEVKALGRADSGARSDTETHNALFWQSAGGPAILWNGVARNLILDPSKSVDLDDSARLFAMLNLAGADAAINCWNDKYHFDLWRPWQAIHQAGSDDNPKTEPDSSWTALLTAPYPEHPSGHLCLDGAQLEVLQQFFGTDKIGTFGVTSSRFGGETRYFERFSEPLKEIIDARIWAGLHFRTADMQAQNLGRKVAHYMSKHYFQPLD